MKKSYTNKHNRRSLTARMAAILAVVLIASVCYTATVFAWFGASITNEGSTITAASYGMTMSYQIGNSKVVSLVENGLYADQTISVSLDESGTGKVILTLGHTDETSIDYHYDLEIRAPENVKLAFGSQSEASTVTSNGTVKNSADGQQFDISINGTKNASVELRILCATSYAVVGQENPLCVIYADDKDDLIEKVNPENSSYLYFLTNSVNLSDEDLTFSGTGSVTIYLNGKTLKLKSMTVAVADNAVRFASVSGGTLVLDGETIRDTDTDKILTSGSGSLHVSLSGLTEDPAESVSPPAAPTAVPEEPATLPAVPNGEPVQEPTEPASNTAPPEESEPLPEEISSNSALVSEPSV